MKKLIIIILACTLFACNQSVKSPGTPAANADTLRTFGAIDDDPEIVKNVPVVISQEYSRVLRRATPPGKKKPPVTDTTVITPPPAPPPTSGGYQIPMPAVSNQGSEGSCVAFAIGYAARSSEASAVLSPEFLFDLTKAETGTCSGSAVITTLDFLKTTGICTWNTLPYTAGSCSLTPTDIQLNEAANYKISSYYIIPTTDTAALKTVLIARHPVIISFMVDSYFYYAGPGFIWRSTSGVYYGRHAVAICGFDDSRHAFKVINSWGTSWGDAGYSWIDYDFLKTVSVNGYVMVI